MNLTFQVFFPLDELYRMTFPFIELALKGWHLGCYFFSHWMKNENERERHREREGKRKVGVYT